MADRGANSGLYAISVVAQLVGTGQQNIRLYERRGLLAPDRTAGGTRQYSDADLVVLRRIGQLALAVQPGKRGGPVVEAEHTLQSMHLGK